MIPGLLSPVMYKHFPVCSHLSYTYASQSVLTCQVQKFPGLFAPVNRLSCMKYTFPSVLTCHVKTFPRPFSPVCFPVCSHQYIIHSVLTCTSFILFSPVRFPFCSHLAVRFLVRSGTKLVWQLCLKMAAGRVFEGPP